jgi:diacylglycerol kinase (ATP)
VKHKNILESWGTAFGGFLFALRYQKNIRILLVIGVLVAALSPFLGLKPVEYMILSVTISLVVITELVNSGLEYAIDLVTDDYHELAKAAKDVAAAAVLISCVNAVAVAGIWTLGKLGWLKL